ncbi:MAG TPA: flagellar biosynthesis anti-sigma factor FlgM [Candidatus Krumholzibacteria bacterium]|nr:flagellar biosynthesis anti-sigma factor FlgM [Candidatus Krumholzibacteria bacterium]
MNPIQNNPLARQSALDAFAATQKRDEKAGRLSSEGGAQPARPERAADKAEISDTAHRLANLRQTLDEGIAAAAAEPDVRADRVAEVKQRLAQGYYQSVEVQAKVADGLGRVIRGIEEL